MVLVLSNEKAFHSFLNDGFKSGYFKLQVKEVRKNRGRKKAKDAKSNVLVFKKVEQPGVVSLFQSKGGKEFGVYDKTSNTLFAENTDKIAVDFNNVVSCHFKLEERKLVKATVEKSPIQEEVVEAPSMKVEEIVEPTLTERPLEEQQAPAMIQEEAPAPVEEVAPAMTEEVAPAASDRINAVKEVFETDLKAAKKVWAILHNGEEVQVESKFFEEAGDTFLGTSKISVNVMEIATVKYRNKHYLG